MNKKILFIQGGGEDGYHEDLGMVNTLRAELGNKYVLNYPELESDEKLPDFGWIDQIEVLANQMGEEFLLMGHSLGASMILKYLTEKNVAANIISIVLLATPFWNGAEDWKKGLKLRHNFEQNLPLTAIHFYHCKDDEIVPFSQMNYYNEKVPQAHFHEWSRGGHHFQNQLSIVAKNIIKIFNDL